MVNGVLCRGIYPSKYQDTVTVILYVPNMSGKIARLGIERDNNKMYFIKSGDVWAAPRKQPGKPKGKAVKVAAVGLDLDYSKYLYYLDSDGDVARKARASGGRRAKAKTAAKTEAKTSARSSISGHYVAKSTAKRHPRTTVNETRNGNGKKSEAQLEREIIECLAKVKGSGYEVSDKPIVKPIVKASPAGKGAKPAKSKRGKRAKKTPRHHQTRRSEKTEPFSLRQVRLDRGGYDEDGRYFGQGQTLWAYDNRDAWGHLRAVSRDAAKRALSEKYPGARFTR